LSERAPFAETPQDLHWRRLMAAAQAGDKAAYADLLRELLPYLRTMARRRFRQGEEAEDAVQDILLTLHTIRHSYDPARPFKPWIVTIARRRIADRMVKLGRRAANETLSALDDDETFLVPAANNPAETTVEAHEAAAAVADLPRGQRQAFELLKMQGLSLNEAAAATGLSVSALKVATHRAVQALRRRLGG
jgi:RNA polymerase sigma-70 factor, ECF subfamily